MNTRLLKLFRNTLCLAFLGTVVAVQPLLAADTTPPSSAPVLFAEPLSPDKIQLSWTIPDDDVGISSYTVFRNGFKIAVTTAPAYMDTGLAADTACDYTVTAWDKGNNPSPVSAAVRSKTFHAWDASQHLLAYWQFNSSSGTTVYDSSPNHYDGKLVGGITWSEGKTGGAAASDGLSGRVQGFPGNAFKYTGGNMTISLWYYSDSSDTDGGYLFSKPWNGSGDYNYYIWRTAGNQVTFHLEGAEGMSFSTNDKLIADEWNHILVTVSSDAAVKLYLNSYLSVDSTYTISGWTPQDGDLNPSLVMGNLYPYPSVSWTGQSTFNARGKIDNVRIYDTVLSQLQVTGIYYSEKQKNGEPVIFVTAPQKDDLVSGIVAVTAEVVGETTGAQFSVYGSSIGPVLTSSPFAFTWDSSAVPNGIYSLTGTAMAGNGTTVSAVSGRFTVRNGDGIIVQVTPAISGTKILPDDTVPAGRPSNIISVTAARGEYEPASFVLLSPDVALTSVTITASALTNGGREIPSTEIDIKSVKAWYQSGTTAWSNVGQTGGRIPVLVPELLLNDDAMVQVDRIDQANYLKVNGSTMCISDLTISTAGSAGNYSLTDYPIRDADAFQPMTVPQGEMHQFWLTVHIPDDALSGTYAGTLTLQADNGFHRALTLQVEVLDFDLVESSITSTLYYTGRLAPSKANIGCLYKTEEQYRAELLDMKKHGVTNPSTYQGQSSQQGSLFVQELAIRRELGMNKGPLYSLGGPVYAGPQSNYTVLDTYLPNLIPLVRSYGYSDLYVYAADEATGTVVTAERPVIEHIHSLGGKAFVAGYTDTFDLIGDLLDLVIYANRTSCDVARDWHSTGKKIACYGNPQAGAENPFLYRRNYGVALWAAGYDGAFDFAYQYNFGLPWNDFDGERYRDHMFTYPTVNGVVDTIAWEGYREAHDDVRYLSTLEAAIVQGAASGDRAKAAAANSAAAWLSTLRQQTITDIGTGTNTADFSINLDAMRNSIITQVRAINNAHAAPDTTTDNGSPQSQPAVYPIPFKGNRDRKLTFVNLQGSAVIAIYTLDGNRVYHEETENATYELIPSRLSSGVYVYVIKDGHGSKKGKLVIIR